MSLKRASNFLLFVQHAAHFFRPNFPLSKSNEKVALLGYIYCVSTSGSEILNLNVSACSLN